MNAITQKITSCSNDITSFVNGLTSFPEDIDLDDGTTKNPWKQLAGGQLQFITLLVLDFLPLGPVPKIFTPVAIAFDVDTNVEIWNGPKGNSLKEAVDLSFVKDAIGCIMLAMLYIAEHPKEGEPQSETFVYLVRAGFFTLLLTMSLGLVVLANSDRRLPSQREGV